MTADRPAAPWTGRDDGPGVEHLRWHNTIEPLSGPAESGANVVIGFSSDAGVARNKGRVGAAAGPASLRKALGGMALAEPIRLFDAGDVVVGSDADLEAGQERLGATVAEQLDAGAFVTVLGGGHEVAFASYRGAAQSRAVQGGKRFGVLNLDAHFDLRSDARPSSGTPFRQMAELESAAGRDFRYAVVGISQPSNTAALFATADRLGVRYLLDEDCTTSNVAGVDAFVSDFLADVDVLYLTIDLDVLPAGVAPGVSAPAACGVALEVISHVCDAVAASRKLMLLDVAELNPELDIDSRTARTAARLIHRAVTRRVI
ncbi:formimidoylglutamase [Gordonia sp. TBRC 11910]|uniref:Formimidoylglutamase n=1 Tax=Gordonia asplenii TaxID=2725283 RepID=A0A848KUG9_9ACTN|nr:formimidoylglutamase [Gordonia asplenii]NMO02336.1 formimidoylglutamase [Gordonia asplenii]